MFPVAQTRARIALATSFLTFIAAASAQEADERRRGAAELEPAPWATPEGDLPPGALQKPALMRAAAPTAIESPIFDEFGDGAVWVLGRNYKARIDPSGLTFVPFLGSSAPRNMPVRFLLHSASLGGTSLPLHFAEAPVRDGNRIWLEHGSITEVFDFAVDSIEQSFVVHRGAALGELDVRLDVETDMPQTMDGLGTWFATSAGGVRYGLAKTLDAGGSELETTNLPVDRAVEFVVSAAEVTRAQGDLTIDPILETVNLEMSTYLDDRDPDVAYDASTGRYIAVFERVYSANDHDIFCQMIDGATGQPISNTWTYIDFTSEDWRTPSVANKNNADQFLVAASVGPEPKVIKCRTRSAVTLSMGTPFALSHDATGGECEGGIYDHIDDLTPVVGGDSWPGGGSSFYCVAWLRAEISLTQNGLEACPDVLFCTVSSTGQAGATQLLESTWNYSAPTAAQLDGSFASLAISKSDGDPFSGASQDWNLVWMYSDISIHAARIHWNGDRTLPIIWLVNTNQTLPGGGIFGWSLYSKLSVSTSQSDAARRFLVTWDALGPNGLPRVYGGVATVWGNIPNSGLLDLTGFQEQLTGGSVVSQWQPSVDCDGTNFVVAFNGYPDGITGVGAAEFGYVTSFGKKGNPITTFRCLEPQVKIAIGNFTMGRTRICAEASGGGARRNMLIGSTLWGGWGSGGYYGGDPLVALHTH